MSDVDEDTGDEYPTSVRKRQPYNKGACRQCGVAKTKCIPIPGNSRCERCEKLNRECIPRTPTHRKRRTAPATTTRVASLEQKLDNIVNLLSTNKDATSDQVSPSTAAASSTEPERTSPEGLDQYSVTSTGLDTQSSLAYRQTRDLRNAYQYGPPPTEATPLRDALRPSANQQSAASSPSPREITFQHGELDNLLRYFQQCCSAYFPFVIAPADTKFQDAHRTLPFLFDVISFVTSAKDFKRQAALGEKLLEDIVNRLLLRPEKTEELLSGMLLYTTWNHIMFPMNGQMTTLLHMMKSIIINLQYDRPPGSVIHRLFFMRGYVSAQVRQMAINATPRSPSEQRAVLGCYYLTSVKCMLSGSLPMDHFELYPYLQACASKLEEMKDQPSDVALAYMVRLQNVVDKINRTLPRGDNPGLVNNETRIPTYMAMKILQAELAETKGSWPDQLINNTTLVLQHYAAEVFLYETAMFEYPSDGRPMDRLQTIEMLSQCLTAIKGYLALYRTIPQWHYPYLPFTVWIQGGLVLQAAVELLFFDQLGWDLQYARSQLDLLGFLDFEMNGIQAVINMRRTSFGGLENKDIFQRFMRRKSNTKSAYEQRLASEQRIASEQRLAAEQQTSGSEQLPLASQSWVTTPAGVVPDIEDIYMGGLYDDFSNSFWQDFVVGPNTWASVGVTDAYMGQ